MFQTNLIFNFIIADKTLCLFSLRKLATLSLNKLQKRDTMMAPLNKLPRKSLSLHPDQLEFFISSSPMTTQIPSPFLSSVPGPRSWCGTVPARWASARWTRTATPGTRARRTRSARPAVCLAINY